MELGYDINFWPVGCGIVMLDFELLAHLPHHLVIQVSRFPCNFSLFLSLHFEHIYMFVKLFTLNLLGFWLS